MSGANAALSLPPGDRDDAPAPARPRLPLGDDAPPLTDETDEARIGRWIAAHATATRYMGEALALLAAGRHAQYASALHHYDKANTEAGALARVLSKSFTAKR
jgi:hypothetical protein